MSIVELILIPLLCFLKEIKASSFELSVTLPTWNHVDGGNVCSALKVPAGGDYYVKKIEFITGKEYLHHFILHGCEEPGFAGGPLTIQDIPPMTQDVPTSHPWACVGGTKSADNGTFSSVCRHTEGQRGMNLRDLFNSDFHTDIGKEVGPRSRLNYFVINSHFLEDTPLNTVVKFKIFMDTYSDPVMGLVQNTKNKFTIPPLSEKNVDCVAPVFTNLPVKVLGVQFHTHDSGRAAAHYKVDKEGKWTTIVQTSPVGNDIKKPSADDIVLENGDLIAFRCYMVNQHNETLHNGYLHPAEYCGVLTFYTFENGPDYAFVDTVKNQCLDENDQKMALHGGQFPEWDWRAVEGM